MTDKNTLTWCKIWLWDIVVVLIGISSFIAPFGMEYVRGRYNIWLTLPMLGLLLYPMTIALFKAMHVLCAIGLLIRALVLFKRSAIYFGIRLVCVAMLLISNHFTFPLIPSNDPFVGGFASRVRHTVDLQELRAWALEMLTIGPQERPQGLSNVHEIPPFVNEIWTSRPSFVVIVPASNEMEEHIKIAWGGHFVGYHGLRVGLSHFARPETPYELQCFPGIYVWWQDEFDCTINN